MFELAGARDLMEQSRTFLAHVGLANSHSADQVRKSKLLISDSLERFNLGSALLPRYRTMVSETKRHMAARHVAE